MFHTRSPVFIALVFTSDVVIASGAWLGAYWLRFHSGLFGPLLGPSGHPVVPPLGPYIDALPAVLGLLWLIYRAAGLYEPKRTSAIHEELWDVARANLLLLAALAALTLYVARTANAYSRAALAIFAILNATAAGLTRASARVWLRRRRRSGANVKRALIVGDGQGARRLAQVLGDNPWTGIELAGFLAETPRPDHAELNAPVLGTYDQISATIESEQIDQVYLCLPRGSRGELARLADQLDAHPVDLRLVPDFPLSLSLNLRVDEFAGIPLISLRESPLEGWGMATKWVMDKAISLIVLTVAAIPMLLIAIGVKLTSRGPVLFRQERIGLNGKPFTMLKFRTMAMRDPDAGPVAFGRADAGENRFADFLRRTSLDELPQFINVLLGHMSVVGPRPEAAEVIPELMTTIPQYMQRLHVRGGITGWAQVNGLRGDSTSMPARIQHDLEYISRWSVWFDLYILLLTFGAVVRHALAPRTR